MCAGSPASTTPPTIGRGSSGCCRTTAPPPITCIGPSGAGRGPNTPTPFATMPIVTPASTSTVAPTTISTISALESAATTGEVGRELLARRKLQGGLGAGQSSPPATDSVSAITSIPLPRPFFAPLPLPPCLPLCLTLCRGSWRASSAGTVPPRTPACSTRSGARNTETPPYTSPHTHPHTHARPIRFTALATPKVLQRSLHGREESGPVSPGGPEGERTTTHMHLRLTQLEPPAKLMAKMMAVKLLGPQRPRPQYIKPRPHPVPVPDRGPA